MIKSKKGGILQTRKVIMTTPIYEKDNSIPGKPFWKKVGETEEEVLYVLPSTSDKHTTEIVMKTDDYYERREKELLSDPEATRQYHNEKLRALTEWRDKRYNATHLQLKEQLLDKEEYRKYIKRMKIV